jgi:DNA segregation ATPase FtsK/SpoIIIE, S-DNA-T family
MKYSPDELELYLLDYKEGVEFQIYVDPNRADTINPTAELDETRALPHAKVISIESDREFGLSVLQAIQQEIETRGQLFKNVGVSELKDYRQKTGKQIPRVLLVIDEFQYMFQDNDAISRDLNQLYEDVIRRGRSFGVHLLLASQSLNIANIKSSIYGLIPLRMAMQMDQTTAGIILAEGNTDAITQLDRSGHIIYNTEFGRKAQNQLGQIADVSLAERRNAMNQIYQQSETTHYQRTTPLTIFQGNRPSKISQNGQLLNLAKLDNWLTSSTLNKQIIHSQDWIPQELPAALWLGEAMRIGHHTQAILRRRARSNMLLIGQSEQSIFGLLSGALLSLVHIYKPTTAEFHIIDLSQTDDDAALSEMTQTFRQEFQDLYPIKLGKRFPDSEQSIKRAETVLSELHTELQRRKQIRDADPDAMNFGPSVFFVGAIGALNRAQNLRPVAGKRADEMSPDAQKLQEIATIGPELGIHTIIWFDNAKTFQQLCAESSPRNLLMQFDCRAVLHLPGEDSRLFLGEPIAEKLPTLRAYYYDAGLSTGFEKFKPYAIPSKAEIIQYAQNLKQRQP